MSIHYARDVNHKNVKTACGHVFDMCSPGECLSGDIDSTDCEECMASDKYKAEAMERALLEPRLRSVLGPSAFTNARLIIVQNADGISMETKP